MSAIDKLLEKVDFRDYLPPVPTDLIYGLIQAQGQPVFHLAFTIMIWFVKKSDD